MQIVSIIQPPVTFKINNEETVGQVGTRQDLCFVFEARDSVLNHLVRRRERRKGDKQSSEKNNSCDKGRNNQLRLFIRPLLSPSELVCGPPSTLSTSPLGCPEIPHSNPNISILSYYTPIGTRPVYLPTFGINSFPPAHQIWSARIIWGRPFH